MIEFSEVSFIIRKDLGEVGVSFHPTFFIERDLCYPRYDFSVYDVKAFRVSGLLGMPRFPFCTSRTTSPSMNDFG